MLQLNNQILGHKITSGCRLRPVALGILFALGMGSLPHAVNAKETPIEFNTDIMDVEDRKNINLEQFSRAGYIMPGEYSLAIKINKSTLQDKKVVFLAPDNDPKESVACLTPEIVSQLGLKEDIEKSLTWWNNGQCLNEADLKGMVIRGDLSASTLYINLPQAYLEYTAENWDPPSRWDDGIPGVMFDYNLNSQVVKQNAEKGADSKSVSGTGVAGMNLGAWRLRADWQAQYQRLAGGESEQQKNWDWNRYYIYRSINALRSRLTLGENYLDTGMFDSFRYVGGSLVSDDNMLPPNLRGYAPEVTGIAKTNAKVTISQQGRVLYETTVAAGPFRIQDLNNAVSGKLDVKVQEQDGSVQTFQLDTANIPYLTRPGMVRFKLAAGQPSDYDHHARHETFVTGEFSWGIDNGWSLYSGALSSGDYTAIAAGVGRDLLALGAVSVDVTQSRAVLSDETTKKGGSYRLSYSKRFDETNSQVTFAGYRFSERDFMTMSQYLDAQQYNKDGSGIGSGKELYTLTFNQQFEALRTTAYLTYNHQTYWNRPTNDTYTLNIAHNFDLGELRNVSVTATAYRTKYDGKNEDGFYLGFSLPWGGGSLSYDTQINKKNQSHTVGYYNSINENNTYRLTAGMNSTGGESAGAYLTHQGDNTELTATANVQGSQYSALGFSMRGGMTATTKGAAVHRVNSTGGTRMLVDTGGVADVPVRGYSGISSSNMFGKAVVSDVSSYYRSDISIDLDNLGNNVEATRSVVEGTLTEGAIGYRKFGILAGQKAMAVIKMADGSAPPFGSTVLNEDSVQTGLVSEEGSVWLSGIEPGIKMSVNWDGEKQCTITLPTVLPGNMDESTLLLPCE
ncbi:outer membrane usher protein [Citrobacter sp. FP75]|uniref:outer membrane usher protein n=1 Tax=Citrobacter sp. FP75 TaxID=1852949 RepID=UPI001BC8E9B8|nr:outer membrane usher protein [Citrobacter sp. FP75]